MKILPFHKLYCETIFRQLHSTLESYETPDHRYPTSSVRKGMLDVPVSRLEITRKLHRYKFAKIFNSLPSEVRYKLNGPIHISPLTVKTEIRKYLTSQSNADIDTLFR